MAEFSLAAVLLLTLGLGAVELAHWMSVRQAVSLALMQAARTGAVTHGNPARMAESFEQALLPIFTPADSAEQRRQAHLQDVQTQLGGPPWHIAVLSPHPAAYLDFDPPAATVAASSSSNMAATNHAAQLPRIDNDYQALQHRRYLAKGWPQGQGPQSGQTIFEANTLTLALTYPHRPMLPATRALLRLLPADATYAGRARRHGYLPLSRQVSLAMQSHPAQWPSLASAKITAATAGSSGMNGGGMGNGNGTGSGGGNCPGCQSGTPDVTPDTAPPGTGGTPGNPGQDIPPPASNPGNPRDTGESPLTPDQDLCGVALCCVD